MNRRFAATLIVGAAGVLGIASAHAGPCTTAIAQVEEAVRQSAGNLAFTAAKRMYNF
jgi:hypothetical protein